MAFKVSKVLTFDKQVADAPGQMAKALAPISAGRVNLLGVWGWTEGTTATIRICVPRATPGQLSTIHGAGFDEAKGVAVCIECENRPGAVRAIGAAIGEGGASMSAFTALAVGKQGTALAFFSDEEAAQRAIQAMKGTGDKVSTAKKTAKTSTAPKEAAKPAAAPKKAAATKKPAAAPKKAAAAKKPAATKKPAAAKKPAATKKPAAVKKPAAKKTTK